MDTGLIRVPLTELRTNDEQTIGSVYQKGSKVYRYVKNAGDTALKARACCLEIGTTVENGLNKKVVAPDTAVGTSNITMPAGMPCASMGKSGSGTGAYGWIQVAGPAKVSLAQSTGALAPGALMIGSSGLPTTHAWWQPITAATAGRYAVLMQRVATTGIETAISAVVELHCL